MRLLLDTHILLWVVDGSPRLSPRAHELIRDASEVFVSSATIWELAIKSGLGKLRADLNLLLKEIDEAGMHHLPVTARQAMGVAHLPHLHRDPFDRLLIAQAISETMRLLTSDSDLAPYTDLVECV